MIEIERKFLVKGAFKEKAVSHFRVQQGYLSQDPERTVRVRLAKNKGYLTIKGKSKNKGLSRFEWEKEIPEDDAKQLLSLCLPGIVSKTRWLVPEKSGLVFEVDVFEGDNTGLVVAEIELPSADFRFAKPEWAGDEVTGQERYYNAQLASHPFLKWDK